MMTEEGGKWLLPKNVTAYNCGFCTCGYMLGSRQQILSVMSVRNVRGGATIMWLYRIGKILITKKGRC